MGTSDTCCVYYLYNYYSTPTRLQINYIYFCIFFLQVNGLNEDCPFGDSDTFTVKYVGKNMVVQTQCGVIVEFDTRHQVMLHVPKRYGSDLFGMCGNCK